MPDKLVDVLTEAQLRRLLATCAGTDFEGRRDTALGHAAGLRWAPEISDHVVNVDFAHAAMVLGKGRRERALPWIMTACPGM